MMTAKICFIYPRICYLLFGLVGCTTVWVFLQILPQVLPEVQSELLEERGQPEGHASLPGGRLAEPQRRGKPPRRLRQHVRTQQLETRPESKEAGPNRR